MEIKYVAQNGVEIILSKFVSYVDNRVEDLDEVVSIEEPEIEALFPEKELLGYGMGVYGISEYGTPRRG